MLRDMKIRERDNPLSCNIVLLFMRVLLEESLHIWSQQRSQTYQTSPHILYDGTFCYHIDGVAMGTPLALTTAKFFMGSYQPAIGMAWKSQPTGIHVDDTFKVWPQNRVATRYSWTHEQFTGTSKYQVHDGIRTAHSITILQCPVKRSVMADWVTMFTENHVTQSEHHAAQEQSSASTLCHARNICEADSLEQECTNFPQI